MSNEGSKKISLKKLANKSTQKKESLDSKKEIDNKVISAPFGNVKIENEKYPFEKDLGQNIFDPINKIEVLDDKFFEEFERKLKLNEKSLPNIAKEVGVHIWDEYFDKYEAICKILNIDSLSFDKKSNIFDKKYDRISEILNLDFANSRLDTVMYGAKRCMIEIMARTKDKFLNCIVFFLFQAMIDIIQLREAIITSKIAKPFIDQLFDEFSIKFSEVEMKIDQNLKKEKEINVDVGRLKDINQRLQHLEINALKRNQILNNLDEKFQTFAKDIYDSQASVYEKIAENLKDEIFQEVETKTVSNKDINKIFGLIRKLNARCQGLHKRIANLEDSDKISIKSESNKHSNNLNSEWEEISDNDQKSDMERCSADYDSFEINKYE